MQLFALAYASPKTVAGRSHARHKVHRLVASCSPEHSHKAQAITDLKRLLWNLILTQDPNLRRATLPVF